VNANRRERASGEMASPQRDDGFTGIANEIMEALIRAELSGQEIRLTLLVIRQTYGYSRKVDTISLSRMAKMSGIERSRCCQVMGRLEGMKIITVEENLNGLPKKYRFNKDYEQWETVEEKLNSRRNRLEKPQRHRLRKLQPSKEILKKKNMGAPPPAPPKDSRIKEAIDHFSALVEQKKGFKPVIRGNRDGAAVKRVLKDMSLEEIKRLFEWYLGTEKAQKHLTISAALSAHSVNAYRTWWESVRWQYE
jgi:phage replication O-like protein O